MKNTSIKKLIVISGLALITLALTSCNPSLDSSTYSKVKAAKTANAIEQKKTQTYALPLATASPADTVTQIYAEKFASEVNRLSEGRIKIQVYSSSTLGGDRDLLESCRDGDIPFVAQNTAPQVAFMPDLAVFDLPEVYSSISDYRSVIDSPKFAKLLNKTYTSGGYHLLGMADQGFRVMSTNKKVESIDDFKGQKIRTMENSYHLKFWKSIGASPLPMSFSEVYIGLQQHTIDAQENPYEVIASNKLYEQQKYIVETNHLPHTISLIMNRDFYEALSTKDQKIMDDASSIATAYARHKANERVQMQIDKIEKGGTQVIRLNDITRKEIKYRAQAIYKDIESHVNKDMYKAYTGS